MGEVKLETKKAVIVTDDETVEILEGIKKGLEDLKAGNFTVEQH